MKPKHQGFTALLVLCSGLLFASGNLGYRFYFQGEGHEPNIAPQTPPTSISVPGPEEVRIMGTLAPKLVEVSIPSASPGGPVTLEPFGYQRPQAAGGFSDRGSGESEESSTYALTFTFSSGARRFCVIDGLFYPQGGILPDGGRIVQIESHKVLVRKKESEIWIPLAAPDDQPEMQSMSHQPPAKPAKGG